MKVGFIGLGIMGKPMCKNLIKAGYEMVVTTHNKETLKEMEAFGAKTVTCGREVAEEANVIITMLPNSPQVREVALGKDGIIEGAKEGSVLIDMSSIDPTESRAIAAELAKNGIEMLDAPVSGGEPKAIDGTISVMAGGKKEIFDKYYDLMMTMAGSVVYVGPIGSGNVAKLANQIIVAVNIAAVSEALTLAKKAGTDPELVRSIMETELSAIEGRHNEKISFWANLGSMGPAWGMIGTLMGLVNMLYNMDDMSKLGPNMGVAIITTFYGSILANWLCVPVSFKLKQNNALEITMKEIMVEGLLSIQAGENPRVIEEKLKSFLAPQIRNNMGDGDGGAAEGGEA